LVHRWLGAELRRRVPVTLSRANGRPLTVAYAGVPHGLTTVLPLVELHRSPVAGETASRTLHQVSRRELSRAGIEHLADVVMVGCTSRQAARLPRRSALILPYRVHLVVDTSGDPEVVRRRIARRERSGFAHNRRVRRWSWEHSETGTDFELFYDRMHRPTMLRRHGERMRTERRDVAYESLMRHGFLFFVVEDGVRVAGALCRWEAGTRTLTTRLLGVLDGADEHYSSGAFKAVYHFLIDWACGHGVDRVDLSGAEPFLSMGIVQWKRRFGPVLALPPNHFRDKRLWFHVARDTDAVRDLLVANPILAIGPDGAIDAVYFHDRSRPARTDILGDFRGVRTARHLNLDCFLSGPEPSPVIARAGERPVG
jgi:hypothetical protein